MIRIRLTVVSDNLDISFVGTVVLAESVTSSTGFFPDTTTTSSLVRLSTSTYIKKVVIKITVKLFIISPCPKTPKLLHS